MRRERWFVIAVFLTMNGSDCDELAMATGVNVGAVHRWRQQGWAPWSVSELRIAYLRLRTVRCTRRRRCEGG
jgi:hypothetical protein